MLSGLRNGIQCEIMGGNVFVLHIGGAVAEAGHSHRNGVQIGVYLRQWDICCTPSVDLENLVGVCNYISLAIWGKQGDH